MPAPQDDLAPDRTEDATETAPEPGSADLADAVPSRRQYLALKEQHPGAVLLYRLGDFYEAFDDDAHTLARDARVHLTSRNFGRSGRSPMAGLPHHALHRYLGRLLAAGHTVAIAEQVSPAGRGLVRREVTRVLTPGTVADAALLPATESRYLAAAFRRGERIGLSWVDVSTGEWNAAEWDGAEALAGLAAEAARLNPAETLLPPDADNAGWAAPLPGHRRTMEPWQADPARAADALCRHFGVAGLHGLGLEGRIAAATAAGMILAHVEHADPALLAALSGVRVVPPEGRVGLDPATRRNLELTRSLGTGGARGSLLGVLDTTRTAMGARALRRLIGDPLREIDTLMARQRVIGALVASSESRAALGRRLDSAGDLERLAARVAAGAGSPRDLLALAEALRQAGPVAALLAGLSPDAPCAEVAFEPCDGVLALLDEAVDADPERVARIRPGFSVDLDRAIADAAGTRQWLASLEGRERERTGIRSLKVGYTKVFGYYLEVTRPNLSLVPPEYLRKQTVAAGERFVTADLKEAEAKLAAADEEIAALEREAALRACAAVRERLPGIQRAARALAMTDALLALAEAAARNGWTAPILTDGPELEIIGGRHPVVEASLAGAAFIPNDLRLGGEHAPRLLVVTGPNMGGKSTYLRQAGLIVLLAQVGSFVPATSARIGLVDRIFTRVGAQDDLARGQSTFMTEMIETAAILRGATARSLLLLDEIGRGTSTGDGLAIARAVLEEIATGIRARCLFATHYLEVTALAGLPGVANAHVGAIETGGNVVFLYAVAPGPADRAYGVQVARLAGLPAHVADRASSLLADWDAARRDAGHAPRRRIAEERGAWDASGSGIPDAGSDAAAPLAEASTGDPAVTDAGVTGALDLAAALRALDLDGLTPREALAWLWERRERL